MGELIQKHCVTFLNWMPGWLDMLLKVGGNRLETLRVVLLGGDWVRPELIRGLRKSAPAVRAAGLGGATETAVHGTICEVDDPPAHWTSIPYGIRSRTTHAVWWLLTDPTARIGYRANCGSRGAASPAVIAAGPT